MEDQGEPDTGTPPRPPTKYPLPDGRSWLVWHDWLEGTYDWLFGYIVAAEQEPPSPLEISKGIPPGCELEVAAVNGYSSRDDVSDAHRFAAWLLWQDGKVLLAHAPEYVPPFSQLKSATTSPEPVEHVAPITPMLLLPFPVLTADLVREALRRATEDGLLSQIASYMSVAPPADL